MQNKVKPREELISFLENNDISEKRVEKSPSRQSTQPALALFREKNWILNLIAEKKHKQNEWKKLREISRSRYNGIK